MSPMRLSELHWLSFIHAGKLEKEYWDGTCTGLSQVCPLSRSHCLIYPTAWRSFEGFQSERGGKILLMVNPQNLFGICNPPESHWGLPRKSKAWEPRSHITVHTFFPSLRSLHTSSPYTGTKEWFIWTSWKMWENWSFFHLTNAMK